MEVYLKYGSVRSAAADWSVYPLGTMFRVKGQPHIYVVDDYGSAWQEPIPLIFSSLLFSTMRQWGTRNTEITVIQWGSYERSVRLLKGRVRHDHCRQMYYGCMKKLNSRVVSKDIEEKRSPLRQVFFLCSAFLTGALVFRCDETRTRRFCCPASGGALS